MQAPMGQASPFVTAKHLNSHIQKTVVVAGKVATLNDNILTLNGGDAGSITVARNRPFQVMIELGMNLMVRGVVNPDLSIAESATFPPTDLGEKFDCKLFNEAATVTSHLNYAHMFS